MYCTHCGASNDPDNRFCISCGAPIERTPQPEQVTNKTENPTNEIPELLAFNDTQQTPTETIPPIAADIPTPSTSSAKESAAIPDTVRVNTYTQPAPPKVASSTRANDRRPFIIIGVASAVLVLVCLIAALTFQGGLWGQRPTAAKSPTTSGTHQSKSPASWKPSAKHRASAAPKVVKLDHDTLDSIVNGYSTTDISVAATTTTGTSQYISQQGNSKFVAAGMYLPIYLAAYDSHNQDAIHSANTMMSSMSNDDANSTLNALGGVGAVTDWAVEHGYGSTQIEREFGDVQASNSGYENYTSSQDAVKMLSAVAADGGQNLMSYNIADDGVSIPSGMSVRAHRGMGIKNSYNYFMLVTDGNQTIALSVMTQNQGKERAVDLTSHLLTAIHGATQAQ